ncbi:MAG: Maf family protein [Candidatus Staskawiczbacteria bacterium]|nr:Maf family protein [Candidatus Staskawiczbacteria bacterium]
MKKIILASASDRRKHILEQVGLEFEVDPSSYEEDMSLEMEPRKLAEFLSLEKAKDVAKKHKNAIIISGDTFCVFNNKIIGKPYTTEKAKETLRDFSGKSHTVVTGFSIIDTESGKQISKSIETKVYFKNLSEEEIDAYIATGEPLEKAGAYGIQHRGALFVEKIEGDFYNIVGMPILPISEELKNFGINIL